VVVPIFVLELGALAGFCIRVFSCEVFLGELVFVDV
jgi:hypothetical protein